VIDGNITPIFFPPFLWFFLQFWGLNSGPCTLLRKQSTTWATPWTLFALLTFWIGSHVFAWGQPGLWSFYLCMCHHAQLYWLRRDLINFLFVLASNYNPPYLHCISSWDYRCELPWTACDIFYYIIKSIYFINSK
jgi:hypothetical protein